MLDARGGGIPRVYSDIKKKLNKQIHGMRAHPQTRKPKSQCQVWEHVDSWAARVSYANASGLTSL